MNKVISVDADEQLTKKARSNFSQFDNLTLKSGDGFKVELQGNLEGDFPFYKVSDTNIDGNEKYLSISNNYLKRARNI